MAQPADSKKDEQKAYQKAIFFLIAGIVVVIGLAAGFAFFLWQKLQSV